MVRFCQKQLILFNHVLYVILNTECLQDQRLYNSLFGAMVLLKNLLSAVQSRADENLKLSVKCCLFVEKMVKYTHFGVCIDFFY